MQFFFFFFLTQNEKLGIETIDSSAIIGQREFWPIFHPNEIRLMRKSMRRRKLEIENLDACI